MALPDKNYQDLANSLGEDVSQSVSRLCASPVAVRVCHKPMQDVLTFESIRSADGFTLCIDLSKLKPDWQASFRGRVPPVIELLNRRSCTARNVTVCFADRPQNNAAATKFCGQADGQHLLIPDYDFLASRAFAGLKQWATDKDQPWASRSHNILWRGVTTGRPVGKGRRIEDLQRVQLCILAKLVPGSDVKIVDLVQSSDPESERRLLTAAAILTEQRLPVETWAGYKFAIDVDGNSSSFNTLLNRQILGCCVLKVGSRERMQQWFYDRLEPWTHYVPVKADMSDLVDIAAWCRKHDDECRKIAERGREFAYNLDFEVETNAAVERINQAFSGNGCG